MIPWLCAIASAHPGADALRPLTCDPDGWLAQSRVLANDGRTDEAVHAIDQAELCGADPERITLARGLTARGDAALEPLQATVARSPDHAGARMALARALSSAGRPAEAMGHATRALARIEHPHPDDVLFTASLAVDPGDQLAILQGGMDRSGPSPAVLEAAARAEVSLGRVDDALARFPSPDPGSCAQRARLLALADSPEASAAYTVAIQAAALASRRTPAVQHLEAALRDELAALP